MPCIHFLFSSLLCNFHIAAIELIMSLPTHTVEATHEKSATVSSSPTGDESSNPPSISLSSFQKLNNRIEGLAGLEARGIERVLPEERQEPSSAADLQVAVLWFSANLSLNNLATGLFGPMVFGLGFLDSALLAVFGTILGACSTAYMATWGPQSGNRTMVSVTVSSVMVLTDMCYTRLFCDSSWATGQASSQRSSTSFSWSDMPPLTASSADRSCQLSAAVL